MRQFILAIVIILLFIQTANAGEPKRLTLSDAIKHTIENSREIKISQEEEKVCYYEKATAIASLIPNFRTQITENPIPYHIWDEKDTQENPGLSTDNHLALGLYWNITDIPRRLLTLNKYKIKSKRDKYHTSLEIKNRIVNTVEKYFSLVYELTKYNIIKKKFNNSNKELQNQEILYNNGYLAKGDLLQSKVENNNIYSDLLDQEKNVNVAKIALNTAMGNDKQENLNVEMNIIIDRKIKQEDILKSFEENDIEKKYSNINLEMIRADSVIATADIIPKVNIGTNYIISRHNTSHNMKRTPGHVELVVSAEINIFDIVSGYNNKKINDLKYKITRMKESLRQSKVRQNISDLFFIYEQEIKKNNIDTKNLALARENAEIAKSRYENGVITLTTYQKALQNERDTHMRTIESTYKIKKIEIQLKALAGKIEDYIKL